MTNTRLFAQATKVAIENMKENEQLRTIMFLEGGIKDALFRVEYYVDGQDDYRILDVRVEVKPLSYKEQLITSCEFEISPTELKIAQEVDYWGMVSSEDFNRCCYIVSETYFDDCDMTIENACLVIKSLIEYGYSLEHIEDMSPRARVDLYDEEFGDRYC